MTKTSRSKYNGGKEPLGARRDGMKLASKIARDLSTLINDPRSKERDLKAFFDAYPGALPTPWLLNHGVHSEFIFPEYQIGARFKCDYMYLTKSSAEWYCVLVEIESPHAKLFRGRGKDVRTHSNLNIARDQIENGRVYLSKDKGAFLRGLAPILFPFSMAKNSLSFKYVLIIGRTAKNDPRKDAHLAALNASDDTHIMTYDSALSDFRYEHRRLPYYDRSLVVAYGDRFRFKRLVPDSWLGFWWYMTPANLELTPEQVQLAENAGIRAEDWRAGRKLAQRPRELSEIFPDLADSSK
jgi:hypothetical protein